MTLAHKFKDISNIDIQQYRDEHPRDISDCLKKLVQKGYLIKKGRCRGTHYSLSNNNHSEELSLLPNSEHNEDNSEHNSISHLRNIAAPIREKKRVKPEIMRKTILELCSHQYLDLKTLADLLDRSPETIRTHYLNPMLDEKVLTLKYPEINHPQQAYKTTF